MNPVGETVSNVYRADSRRVLATLIRLLGDFDVAEEAIRTHRAAMSQILQDLQPLLDDRMRFATLDMGDEPDAAGVMFVGGIVQPLAGRKGRIVHGITSTSATCRLKIRRSEVHTGAFPRSRGNLELYP